MKKQFVLLVIMLSLCLQGCFFYFPRPGRHFQLESVRTSRDEIDSFLKIGKTSREEIQEAWGHPYINMKDRNIWMYTGVKITGYWGYIIGGLHPMAARKESIKKILVLLIKFDNDNRVKRYELTELAKGLKRYEVRQQALEWDNSSETPSK